MWNAVIAGAGPAGAAAACVLARAGRRVLLADADEEGFRVGEALHGAARPLLREIGAELPAADGPHALIGGNLSGWGSDALVACSADQFGVDERVLDLCVAEPIVDDEQIGAGFEQCTAMECLRVWNHAQAASAAS